MRFAPIVIVPAVVLACTPPPGTASSRAGVVPMSRRDSLVAAVTGMYQSHRTPTQEVWISSIGRGVLHVRCGDTCYSVGFWDGSMYRGVLRTSFDIEPAPLAGREGDLRFEIVAKDTLRASIRVDASKPAVTDTWIRRALVPGHPGPGPESPPYPKIGDYVYVEELPEAVTRVPAAYPEEARKKRIEGTVMVQALVGRDGRVKETQVLKGIPELDQAAEDAVRQWVFKPAIAEGAPVAVWVAVPIKFALE